MRMKQIIGLVTDKELATVKAAAAEECISVSSYVRDRVLGLKRRQKLTQSQRNWNYRAGVALLRAHRLEQDPAWRATIEDILAEIGTE